MRLCTSVGLGGVEKAMSWLIVGTVASDDFPILNARCRLAGGTLHLDGEAVKVARGTPALLGAACATAEALGIGNPRALLVGDTGRGEGSIQLYRHLVENLQAYQDHLIVFHYLQPDVDWHNRVLLALDDLPSRPQLVADAGYMYVAKMSGFAASYDLFTPDVGEMAFLADESAPHPFYTRGFLLRNEDDIPELVKRAYENENSSRHLLVKGRNDYVASSAGILHTISEPCVPAMEPIGGTGDTLTGIVGALIAAGKSVPEAALVGARVNRLMGLLANPSPACSVADLLPSLPKALESVLSSS